MQIAAGVQSRIVLWRGVNSFCKQECVWYMIVAFSMNQAWDGDMLSCGSVEKDCDV